MDEGAGTRGRASSAAVAGAVTLAVVAIAWPSWQLSAWAVLTTAWAGVGVALVVGGFRLGARRDQRRNGQLLLVAGVLEVLSIGSWDRGPVFAFGWVASALVELPLIWLLLQYPGDRLEDHSARAFVRVLIVIVLGLRLLETVLWDPSWGAYRGRAWWPTLGHSLFAHTIVSAFMWVSNIVFAVVFVVLLWRHHHRMVGLSRRQQVPLLIAGCAGAAVFGLVVPVGYLLGLPSTAPADPVYDAIVGILQVLALGTILCAFAVGALLAALHRARVGELLVDLETAPDPVTLELSLRAVFADNRLQVMFREDAARGWVDCRGLPVEPGDDPSRVVVAMNRPGEVATEAMEVDAGLTRDRRLLDAAVRASRLALDNARLQALAQARLGEVRRSRERLALVGIKERRRLERDLHDGAQQSLLAVAAGVAAAQASTDDPAMKIRLEDVRDGLRTALQELRDLANGIHPAILTQSGLGPAVESAAERLAVSARIQIEDRRWPAEIESAAYFVTLEALSNAVKHSGATAVIVRASSAGQRLDLTIADDGVGGATASPDGRGGLMGIRDRVTALGGDLQVLSPPAGGTTITAWLPCG
ncbi:MAG: sensor histidine kinase [Cellulomonas sp.]